MNERDTCNCACYRRNLKIKEQIHVFLYLFVSMFIISTAAILPYKTWGPTLNLFAQNHPFAANVLSAALFAFAITFSSSKPKKS